VRLWGKNLTNPLCATQLTETGFGDNAEYAPARTYGITVGLNF